VDRVKSVGRFALEQRYTLSRFAQIACAALIPIVLGAGCASQFLRFDGAEKALSIDEFDREQKIFEIPDNELVGPPEPVRDDATSIASEATGFADGKVTGKSEKGGKIRKGVDGPGGASDGRTRKRIGSKVEVDQGSNEQRTSLKKSSELRIKDQNGQKLGAGKAPVPVRRLPEIEDEEGFTGRRPNQDPFRVGEEIVFDISYWGIDAGELAMRVLPFVSVNGRKSYRFQTTARTVSVFESIYKVNDIAETYLEFEEMRPSSYRLNIKETNQLGNARAIHDWPSGMVRFWEKKVTKEGKVEEKKFEWEGSAFAQNAFSSIWYLRTFQLKPGRTYKFWLAHENENLLIECEVLRQERLKTSLGTFETVVIKPRATKNGEPHSIGDNLFWMTADDRKLPVRIESKIKIGKIVGSLAKLARAEDPVPQRLAD